MDLLKGMLQINPESRLSADEALTSPLFKEGAVKEMNKFSSVEDLDSQLRKFKEKFRKKNRKEEDTNNSMHFNIHPDMQHGIATYRELSENQSNGSNQYIHSIDHSANEGDNKSAKVSSKGSSKGNLAAGKKDGLSMYKYTLISKAHGNIADAFDDDEKDTGNRSFEDRSPSKGRLDKPEGSSLTRLEVDQTKSSKNNALKKLHNQVINKDPKSKFAAEDEEMMEDDD